jgi:hypothetical protein
MSDKCSIRVCPPRSAIDLLAEAEARKKQREEEKLKRDFLGRENEYPV